MQPLILSLKLDKSSFDVLDELRRRHFPPERNFLSAHVTLFHALPGEQESLVKQNLREISANTEILSLKFPKLRFLGKGVAVEIECPALLQLRKKLASVWHDFLGAQDLQGSKPHVTIQNKVAPDVAKHLYESLAPSWQMPDGTGEGLLLWQYLNGPWKLIEEFAFAKSK